MANKILIVDDEEAVRDTLRDLLKKEGYDVLAVESGEGAIDAIRKEDFEAVLMDVRLNGISGLESLKKIKELKPDTIVIMITGFSCDDELVTKSNELGCSGYIGKNASISEIINCFRSFIKEAKEKSK